MGLPAIVRTLIIASFVLIVSADSARILQLPIATTEANVLDFWPGLNASCNMNFLQDNICCAGSTFQDESQAQRLLVQALQSVALSNADELSEGGSKLAYDSASGLQVATEYFCDVPMAPGKILGRSCQRCLWEIVDQILSSLSESKGTCRNAWGLRFGFIFEPDSPWEEDTTWCHLDYWFRVVPSSSSSHSNLGRIGHEILTLARDLLWWWHRGIILF